VAGSQLRRGKENGFGSVALDADVGRAAEKIKKLKAQLLGGRGDEGKFFLSVDKKEIQWYRRRVITTWRRHQWLNENA